MPAEFPDSFASSPLGQARQELHRDTWVGLPGTPGPGRGPYGPIGPLWAHKGPYGPNFVWKIINFDENS